MVIGIYPRKSVYRDNSDSVQVQVQMCREYAGIIFKGQSLEFRIYDKDEGFSGKNTNRPSFKELMADVQSDLLDAVIVYKLDRISRNVREFSAMYDIFQQHNVAFVSVKESFDTSTPMGRTVMYILAAFAQLERENTSERVADNMLALGAAGRWTGGRCPAGMVSVKRSVGGREHSFLVVDENTIGSVKLLYALILEGYSITKAERYCRDHGIRSQAGRFLSTSQIYNILTNPVYCQNSPEAYDYFEEQGCTLPDRSLFDGKNGLIGYGKTKNSESSQSRQDKKHWTISVGIHPFVISSSDWIYVQSRLKVNKMYYPAKYEIGLLKGVIHCQCGSRMDIRTYQKNGIVFSYYYCAVMARQGRQACPSEYVRVEQMDDLLLNRLRQIRLCPESIQLRTDHDTPSRTPAAITSDLDELQEAIGNLTTALSKAMEGPAASYIIAKIEELDTQKKNLEADLRRARLKEKEELTLAERRSVIYTNICYLLDHFDHISYTGKNELIRKTLRSAVFDGENLNLIF